MKYTHLFSPKTMSMVAVVRANASGLPPHRLAHGYDNPIGVDREAITPSETGGYEHSHQPSTPFEGLNTTIDFHTVPFNPSNGVDNRGEYRCIPPVSLGVMALHSTLRVVVAACKFTYRQILMRLPCTIATMLVLSSCSTVALTGRRQLLLVSDSEMLSLANQSYTEYMSTATRSTNASQVQMVNTVASRLVNAVETYMKNNNRASELNNFRWEFNLTKDAQQNAFCMPGGKIVVYDGILPCTQTPDGLAAVLGHEIAHAIARHSAEKMSQQMLLSMGSVALGAAMANKSEMTQMIAMQVFGLGTTFGVTLPFSRKDETEADEMGVIFAAMAGYDPRAAISFWERMAATGGSGSQFFSTHPSSDNRIKKLQKLMPKALKYYQAAGGNVNTGGSATRVFTPSELRQ